VHVIGEAGHPVRKLCSVRDEGVGDWVARLVLPAVINVDCGSAARRQQGQTAVSRWLAAGSSTRRAAAGVAGAASRRRRTVAVALVPQTARHHRIGRLADESIGDVALEVIPAPADDRAAVSAHWPRVPAAPPPRYSVRSTALTDGIIHSGMQRTSSTSQAPGHAAQGHC
jgi:hypothetical protein